MKPVDSKITILQRLASQQGRIHGFGVRRLGLFGSFVRGEQQGDSDVDLLVEFQPEQKTFDNFLGLAVFLEELFGRKVEVVTTESLSPHLGAGILQQVEYAALDP